jgi:Sulfotransferase family
MSSKTETRRQSWQPPARPDWVAKVNHEGACMDIKSVVPLDENSLLNSAREGTGLQDFGADDWYEPFQVLIKSYEEESRLNLMGRLMTRNELLLYLKARLQIEEAYKQHPEIEDEEIVAPLLVTGQGRTGTSIMQNVLSEDPENGTILTWEVFFPCPPPEAATYHTDPRGDIADKLITQYYRVTPDLEAMHEFSGRIPSESLHLQCLSFYCPSWFNLMGQIPSYNAYMAARDMVPAYRYEKRILKLLQWKNPRKTWVLKTPEYINYMPDVLKVYPDANIVWLHRDPIKAMSSAINILGNFMWQRSDHPFLDGSFEYVTDASFTSQFLLRPIEWIEKGVVPKERLLNLQYQDFIKDPVGQVRQLYQYFGIERPEASFAAMQDYMDRHPRDNRPSHKYSAGDTEQIQQERLHFQPYQEYFKVPSEV